MVGWWGLTVGRSGRGRSGGWRQPLPAQCTPAHRTHDPTHTTSLFQFRAHALTRSEPPTWPQLAPYHPYALTHLATRTPGAARSGTGASARFPHIFRSPRRGGSGSGIRGPDSECARGVLFYCASGWDACRSLRVCSTVRARFYCARAASCSKDAHRSFGDAYVCARVIL